MPEMEVHNALDQLPDLPSPVVTMGSFDGVHAGHRVIIKRLNQLAGQADGCSVLITFDPHPRKVLYPDTAGKDLKLISTLEEKCLLLEEAGLDHLLILGFSREFAKTSSEDFVRDILVARIKAHTIVVGFNHFFGHNKQGSFESLYRVREQYGFRVEEIPVQEIHNETVSSTKIRKALGEGHIQRANAYLEHYFMMKATLGAIHSGDGIKGFPCAEILPGDEGKLLPPAGMYAVSMKGGPEGGKGLIHIRETTIIFYPLGGELSDSPRDCLFFFKKHLEMNGLSDPGQALQAVEELVY